MTLKQPISRTISYLLILTFGVLWWILSKKYKTWNLQTFKYITPYEWQFLIYPHKRDGSTIASSTVSLIRLFVPIAICLIINSVLFFTNRKFKDFVGKAMVSTMGRVSANESTSENEIKWYHWFTKSNLIFADFSDLMHCQALNAVISGFLVSFIKTQIGAPRPDFFDRCFPTIGVTDLSQVKQKITNLTTNMSNDWDNICEEKDPKLVRGGLLSFPSGHSCNSMSAGIFICLYTWGKLSAVSIKLRGNESAILWRVLVGFSGVIFGVWVACSRISDYRHHCVDVFCGSFLGFVCTIFVYGLFYPSVYSEDSQWSFSQLEVIGKSSGGGDVADVSRRRGQESEELNFRKGRRNSVLGVCL